MKERKLKFFLDLENPFLEAHFSGLHNLQLVDPCWILCQVDNIFVPDPCRTEQKNLSICPDEPGLHGAIGV